MSFMGRRYHWSLSKGSFSGLELELELEEIRFEMRVLRELKSFRLRVPLQVCE